MGDNELLSDEELFEAEYRLANCIRITLTVEDFKTEVFTGKRWVPVVDYVKALIERQRNSNHA